VEFMDGTRWWLKLSQIDRLAGEDADDPDLD
jgi:hypothetical protein